MQILALCVPTHIEISVLHDENRLEPGFDRLSAQDRVEDLLLGGESWRPTYIRPQFPLGFFDIFIEIFGNKNSKNDESRVVDKLVKMNF